MGQERVRLASGPSCSRRPSCSRPLLTATREPPTVWPDIAELRTGPRTDSQARSCRSAAVRPGRATETWLFVREGAAVVFGDVLGDDGKKVEAAIRASGGRDHERSLRVMPQFIRRQTAR